MNPQWKSANRAWESQWITCTLCADLWNHCGYSLHKQTDFLWIHSLHKCNGHFLMEHCFSQGSEVRKMHGVTWHTALWMTRHGWDGCSAITSSPKTIVFEKGLDKGQKVGQHSSTNTLIEVATTQWLWNTLDCGWPLRDGLVWLTLTMRECLTPSHHTHICPIQPSNPPFHPSSLSNSNPLAFCPFHNTPHSPFAHCMHAITTYHLIAEEERKKRVWGFVEEKEWHIWVAFLKSHKTTQHFSTIINTERDKERGRKRLLQPYQEESTTSRLISEVKPLQAWFGQRLETTWEHQVL